MHIRSTLVKLIPAVLALQLTACSDGTDVSDRAKQPIQHNTTTATNPVPATTAANYTVPASKTGIVKSAKVAGGYSYIEAEIDGGLHWIATAALRLSPGDTISWNDHALMRNFTSKAMNRTFDHIMFVDRVSKGSQNTASQNSGTVLTTQNAAGYSYIEVQQAGNIIWIAAPQMLVNAGQTINWSGGTAMHNFSSRSLNRTFDKILFVNAVDVSNG